MSAIASATTKACRVCGGAFLPFLSTQIVCGVKCAKRVPVIERKATKVRLAELQPLGHWQKQAQSAFNAWVRLRDAHLPCISCGRMHAGSWDAGHYLSAGARPELRFDEANVHRQCVPCNQHLHGNLVLFRRNLIERIGQAEVDRLEGPHAPRQLRAEDLRRIRDEYRSRAKALTQALKGQSHDL